MLPCVQGCVCMYYFLSSRTSTSAPSSMNSQTTRPEMFWRRPSSTAKTWWLWSWLWTRPQGHISPLTMKMWVHTGTDTQSKTQSKQLWFSHSLFNYWTETLFLLLLLLLLLGSNTHLTLVYHYHWGEFPLSWVVDYHCPHEWDRCVCVCVCMCVCVLTICQLINPSCIRMWSHLGIN